VIDSENFKTATTIALKAMARRAEIEPYFSGAQHPDGETNNMDRPRLPAISGDADDDQLRLIRASADIHALKNAYHDQSLHLSRRPSGEAGALFEALEQARVEALGMGQMDGVAQNLNALMDEKFRRKSYTAPQNREDIPFEDALHMMARAALTGENIPKSAQAAHTLWHDWAAGLLGDTGFEALRPLLGDQEKFARAAHKIITDLKINIGDAAGDNPPEDSDNQAQGDDGQPEQEEQAQDQGEGESAGDFDDDDENASAPDNDYDLAAQDQWDDAEGQADSDAQSATGTPANRPEDFRYGPEGAYTIYTTQFDEEISADELADTFELARLRQMLDQQLAHHQAIITKLANRLGRKLMARQQRHWQFDLEEGILDPSRLARIIANPNVPMSYKQESKTEFRDTVVTLLIDNSGSMRGRPIGIAAMSADIIGRTLERCGVKVEILGFTTRAWKGGKARDLWLQNDRPENPGRLNDVRHIIYKGADEPWRRTRKNLGLMLKEGVLKENIDGEALVWAHNRLSPRSEARKILLVISDGAPVDDSTLSSNPSSMLEQDLRNVIRWIENKSGVEVSAIGIGHDVTRYYSRAITIKDADSLAKALVGQLENLFDESSSSSSPRKRGSGAQKH